MTNEPADTNPFPEWLEEVADAPLVIDQSQDGLSHECHGNHWSFAISQSQAEVTTVEDVLNFLSGIMSAREQQIKAHSRSIDPMLFYCWFDEQACHLCFSLVSTYHDCIPFGAIVEETNDITRVVKLFLSSHLHNGLPLEEFMIQEDLDISNISEPAPYILLVATKILPEGII